MVDGWFAGLDESLDIEELRLGRCYHDRCAGMSARKVLSERSNPFKIFFTIYNVAFAMGHIIVTGKASVTLREFKEAVIVSRIIETMLAVTDIDALVDAGSRAFLYSWNTYTQDILGHILPSCDGYEVAEENHLYRHGHIHRVWHSILLLQYLPMWLFLRHFCLLGTSSNTARMCVSAIRLRDGIYRSSSRSNHGLGFCNPTHLRA